MMKYEKPEIDVIEFQISENITDEVGIESTPGVGEGVEDGW